MLINCQLIKQIVLFSNKKIFNFGFLNQPSNNDQEYDTADVGIDIFIGCQCTQETPKPYQKSKET